MVRVLLFGAGSIGTCYIFILQKAGADVTAVCRSNYEAAKRDGLTLNSEKFGPNLKINPEVVRSVSDAEGAFDYVLVACKAFPGSVPSVPSLIAPAVGPSTTIALIQNGIEIEKEFSVTFPQNPLLSCVVYLPAMQTSPTEVSMGNLEWLEIGAYPSNASKEPAIALAELLKRGGGEPAVFDDIQPRRWSKLLVNGAWNPICALTRCRDVEFMESSPAATDFIYSVMLEVVHIAQALGYEEITEADATMQLERAKARLGTKGTQPSMLGDVLADRPMEIEAIAGNVLRLGQKYGVSTVRLEALYLLLKALDFSIQKKHPVRA